MDNIKKLPESEAEIMMIIWEADRSVSSDYIMANTDKTWTKTTVLNFLTRLCNRGFLECEKSGRTNLYTSIISKDEYLQKESRSFLQKMYHNSLTNMVASLYDGKSITKKDLEELKKFIEEAE